MTPNPDLIPYVRPIMIAPAPSNPRSTEDGNGLPQSSTMQYSCQSCARRKVKCDRLIPVCERCVKGKLDCVYQAPPPRPRKRKRRGAGEDVYQRLARYELILRENGLLEEDDAVQESTPESISHNSPRGGTGKLVAGDGKSRYVDGTGLLTSVINDYETSDEEEDMSPLGDVLMADDPLSGALLGYSQSLSEFHPSYEDATKLWSAYVQNVDPICKVLHVPTISKMRETMSQRPSAASKASECLLFSIYHFAVLSMSEADCVQEYGESKTAMKIKYQSATRHALVNSSWLKTTDLQVMQAYVLYLAAMRTRMDRHTYWMLTGVAVRIAQRMGLHRDGESLGLNPFDVEMHRRLFWQLLPLDGYAAGAAGTGIAISPNSWDTKLPLNVNDDQIFPGMTEKPEEYKGASDMIFFLAKAELSNLYNRTGVKMDKVGGTVRFKQDDEIERLVDEVENTLESRFLRYCDIVNPLHFLTLGITRSATNAVRLRNRMAPLVNKTIDDQGRRDLCILAQKILDTDSAAYNNPSIRKFQWHVKAFFIWDAVICILSCLAKPAFFSPAEFNSTWGKIEEVYSNHQELLEPKSAIHITIGKVTLKTWDVNPATNGNSTPPDFITRIRAVQETRDARRRKIDDFVVIGEATEPLPGPHSPGEDVTALFGAFEGGDFNFDDDFEFSTADWIYWDQLNRA